MSEQLVIDVSEHNGEVDWQAVKDAGYHAIIRAGFGRLDSGGRLDYQWERNVGECERLGIPYGVYWYSYATRAESGAVEASHLLAAVEGHDPSYPLYFDSEEPGTEGAADAACNAFADVVEGAGYWCGVYCSRSWLTAHLSQATRDRLTLWVADWTATWRGAEDWDLWQQTDSAQVPGVGRCDLSRRFRDLPSEIAAAYSTQAPEPAPQGGDVLSIALGEVGYSAPDDPEEGSKYGRWMADLTGEEWLRGTSTEVWWCCMFVSWCMAQAGVESAGFPSYNTDLVLQAGPRLVYREDARPGDIVIWDWDGNSATDHIGIVVEHEPGALGRLVTVEGNYRNSVALVERSDVWGCVSAVIRPDYAEATGTGEMPLTPPEQINGVDAGTYHRWVSELQGALNAELEARGLPTVAQDGEDGPETQAGVVRLLQDVHNKTWGTSLSVDGVIGPETLASIKAHPVGFGGETSGDDVWCVKAGLVTQGWDVDLLDRTWSKRDHNALCGHQGCHGLETDGVCGPLTLPTLLPRACA